MVKQYSGSGTPEEAADRELRRRLKAAQRKVRTGPDERRAAVLDAKAAGWSDYRIAKELPADQTTVRAILTAAQKQEPPR